MRKLQHRLVPAAALAALLLVLATMPALAKEGLTAAFDAPIALGTPGGTTILVGMMVTVPDGATTHPVEGSPIYLKLFGRDGSFTRASGAVDGVPGHYTMRIVVPEGGPRGVEVGIHGTTDLPMMLAADPFVSGGITEATAQLAPALPPAMTPFPRAVVPAAEPAATPVPAADPGPSPLPVAFVAVAVLAAVAGMAGLLLARRRPRGEARPVVPGRAPGS